MNKKLIIFIVHTVGVSFLMQGMEPSQLSKSDGATITAVKKDGKKKIPRLNLNTPINEGSSGATPKVGSKSTPKTSINNGQELTHRLQNARSLHRQTSTQRPKRPLFRQQQNQDSLPVITGMDDLLGSVVVDMPTDNDGILPQRRRSVSPPKTKNLLPKAVAQQVVGLNLPDDERSYSEEEVWEMLLNFNPPLYSFGQKHKMDLDQVREYSVLFQGFEIEPQALVEFVRTHSNNNDKNSSSYLQSLIGIVPVAGNPTDEAYLVKKYGKIKKDKPEEYGSLILEVIKAVCDQADGQDNQSMIASTHIGLQDSQINEQQGTIRQQYIALAVKFILLIGTTAWALYGQFSTASAPVAGNSTR